MAGQILITWQYQNLMPFNRLIWGYSNFTPVVITSTSIFLSVIPVHGHEVLQHKWKEKILRQKQEKVITCLEYELFVEIIYFQ